ncbi:hypothetical protein [Clostridium lacusfryxellense]|uniref:hypothetical protein n=1 Tax=Clostridium lacusfryxellense TaxID=205328 RepID=UPI001C0B8023|nr:hypothetical protein [Clostridium lacusfryxellense]MBU3111546.1 hypothetical protein [Clostridium lacusfryxellense]
MNLFFVIYLVCIEMMIFLGVMLRLNEEYMDFKLDGYKISIWCGIARVKFIIICKKVALVHVDGQGKDLNIVILTTSRFRNKKIHPIDIDFIKQNPYVAKMYYEIKVLMPEENYFYFTINHGGFKKYILLDELYKFCVSAVFSGDAIEKIKEYRDKVINLHVHK